MFIIEQTKKIRTIDLLLKICYDLYRKIGEWRSKNKEGEMGLIIKIDAVFLAFFNRIARAFARLTGKSNFFLAKIAVWLVIISAMTTALNYWLPILARKTNPFIAALYGYAALLFLTDIYRCDRAEDAATNDERTRIFSPAIYSPIFRALIVIMGVITAPSAIFDIASSAGIMLAKILDNSYMPAFAAFIYFASLDPPQMGKSKVREWVEGFANSFRQLVPISVKRK